MISIKSRTARLVPMALLSVLAFPALAGPIVVRAVGPSAVSYKPGQKLADTATLVLKAGDQVTVLDAKGTRSFSGPGSFRFDTASASAETPTAFADLLTQKPERRARIGAVRGSAGEMTGPATPPGVWAIDVGASGTVCAIDPAKLSLWRAEPMAAGAVTITRTSDGKSAPVAFAPGASIAAWPATLVPASGDQFRVSGAGAPATMTLRTVKGAASVDVLGAELIDAGCMSQFERLARATKVTDAPAS
ncbi:MAG: hypothetical protein ACOYLS_04260 [Polymorphobacter sp.]